jgi:hypothetical protein
MKRGFVLLALVVLVVWLASAAPTGVKSAPTELAPQPVLAAPNAVVPQEQCCADPNESDPHWECFSNTCLQVNGCGPNVNCATCGCDPFEELACVSDGGDWDPNTCTCSYSCDPGGYEEAYCWSMGGNWNPITCTCTEPQCNPGTPQITYTDHWTDSYCDGYWQTCDHTCDHYVQRCQDNSIYQEWEVCFSYCDQGDWCGGGGGDDPGNCATYRPGSDKNKAPGLNNLDDCWCDEEYGICCDWDWYCWEM